MPSMFADEMRNHFRLNRAPMIFWTAVIVAPVAIAALVAWAYVTFFATTKAPSDPADIDVALTDRSWSIYQSLDCIQAGCESIEGAKAFVSASTDGTLTITSNGQTRAFAFMSTTSDDWSLLATMATDSGDITHNDVASTVKATTDSVASFTTPSGSLGTLTYSSASSPQLRSIEIGRVQ